jgi:hypothetical protein
MGARYSHLGKQIQATVPVDEECSCTPPYMTALVLLAEVGHTSMCSVFSEETAVCRDVTGRRGISTSEARKFHFDHNMRQLGRSNSKDVTAHGRNINPEFFFFYDIAVHINNNTACQPGAITKPNCVGLVFSDAEAKIQVPASLLLMIQLPLEPQR